MFRLIYQANVFIADEGHIQIADFGLSVFSEGLSKNYFSMRSGSARWLAPELLDPLKYRKQSGGDSTNEIDWSQLSSRPTKPSDVYTFSCLCIEVPANSSASEQALILFHSSLLEEPLFKTLVMTPLSPQSFRDPS